MAFGGVLWLLSFVLFLMMISNFVRQDETYRTHYILHPGFKAISDETMLNPRGKTLRRHFLSLLRYGVMFCLFGFFLNMLVTLFQEFG